MRTRCLLPLLFLMGCAGPEKGTLDWVNAQIGVYKWQGHVCVTILVYEKHGDKWCYILETWQGAQAPNSMAKIIRKKHFTPVGWSKDTVFARTAVAARHESEVEPLIEGIGFQPDGEGILIEALTTDE